MQEQIREHYGRTFTGSATGIDMTDEQLTIAHRHTSYYCDAFGHRHGNIRFVLGDTTSEPTGIDGNTSRILAASRFTQYFELSGDFNLHHGAFCTTASRAPAANPCTNDNLYCRG